MFHRRAVRARRSGQLGGRMWSGPKTRGLHHTVQLQTLDQFFNKWYDLSDFSDPGANQSELLQPIFLLHYIGEHVSVDSGADSTGKTVFSCSQYRSYCFIHHSCPFCGFSSVWSVQDGALPTARRLGAGGVR